MRGAQQICVDAHFGAIIWIVLLVQCHFIVEWTKDQEMVANV